jgi:hypothetical protein
MSAQNAAKVTVYGAVDSRALVTNHQSQLTKTFFVLLFAVVGIIITSAISADSARRYAAFDIDSGVKTGNVVSITDSSASGGTAIRFNAPLAPVCPTGQTGTPPNCVSPPATCPAGQIGTPPNCASTPTAMSPKCTSSVGYVWANLKDCGWPDASNTGPAAGTALTATAAGDRNVAANTVVQNQVFTGRILIHGSNVTLKNVRLTYSGTGNAGYGAIMIDAGVTNTTIQNVEIIGGGKVHKCINDNGGATTITALNCSGVEDGYYAGASPDAGRVASTNNNDSISESYFHDFIPKSYNNLTVDPCSRANGHMDAIQFYGGNNLKITHNTFKMTKGAYTVASQPVGFNQTCASDRRPFQDLPPNPNSTLFITDDYASLTNMTVSSNLFSGGADWAIYAYDRDGAAPDASGKYFLGGNSLTNAQFLNNKFSSAYKACGGGYGVWFRAYPAQSPLDGGPTDGWGSGTRRKGNTILETGYNLDSGNKAGC